MLSKINPQMILTLVSDLRRTPSFFCVTSLFTVFVYGLICWDMPMLCKIYYHKKTHLRLLLTQNNWNRLSVIKSWEYWFIWDRTLQKSFAYVGLSSKNEYDSLYCITARNKVFTAAVFVLQQKFHLFCIIFNTYLIYQFYLDFLIFCKVNAI